MGRCEEKPGHLSGLPLGDQLSQFARDVGLTHAKTQAVAGKPGELVSNATRHV